MPGPVPNRLRRAAVLELVHCHQAQELRIVSPELVSPELVSGIFGLGMRAQIHADRVSPEDRLVTAI